jgi:hypothetical protein
VKTSGSIVAKEQNLLAQSCVFARDYSGLSRHEMNAAKLVRIVYAGIHDSTDSSASSSVSNKFRLHCCRERVNFIQLLYILISF